MSQSEFRMRGIESGLRETRTAETVGENGRHGKEKKQIPTQWQSAASVTG